MVPGSVSKYDNLLVVWGFGVPCDHSVTVGTWGERLARLSFLTRRASGEHKASKPWGIKYRPWMPGSALTVTPWLVSPLNKGSRYLCYTHPYLLWLKTNWSSTIRAFLLLLKVGDLRKLVCECLHCAKTYSKPIRIYICYKLFISSWLSKYYLPSRMGVIGLKNNQHVNCGSGMWTQTSLTLESLIFRRNTHKASITCK